MKMLNRNCLCGITAACCLTNVAVCSANSLDAAVDHGFYLGIQGGVAHTGYNKDTNNMIIDLFKPVTVHINSSNQSIYSRFFAGYQMNKYSAFEFGIGVIPSIKYDLSVDLLGVQAVNSNEYVYDAYVKGILPLNDSFSVYGKIGFALLEMQGFNASTSLYGVGTFDTKDNALVPTGGIGLTYNFTPHFGIGLFGTYYAGNRSFSGTSVGGLTLSYTF
jgi:hypothetical protein